jgi:DNA modification methylase
MTVNKLIAGDNLAILKTLDSDTVDLMYLDPIVDNEGLENMETIGLNINGVIERI